MLHPQPSSFALNAGQRVCLTVDLIAAFIQVNSHQPTPAFWDPCVLLTRQPQGCLVAFSRENCDKYQLVGVECEQPTVVSLLGQRGAHLPLCLGSCMALSPQPMGQPGSGSRLEGCSAGVSSRGPMGSLGCISQAGAARGHRTRLDEKHSPHLCFVSKKVEMSAASLGDLELFGLFASGWARC